MEFGKGYKFIRFVKNITRSAEVINAMGKKGKRAESISIISGSDGPTSLFILGGGRPNLRQRLQKIYFTYKKKWIARKVTPGTHTMEEVTELLKTEYGFEEIEKSDSRYSREYESLRSSFILMYKAELLGELADKPKLLSHDEEGIKEWQRQLELREQRAKEISKEQFDIDLYILEKKQNDVFMRFMLEGNYDYIGGSFSGSGKVHGKEAKSKRKKEQEEQNYKEIFKQVYRYYGVTEKDIAENTRRYKELLTVLAH